MRKRLMLCTAAVVIVGFVLAFSLAGFLVQNQYQNEFTRRLDAMLAMMCAESQQMQVDPQRFAKSYGMQLQQMGQDIRVTVLDQNGDVKGDSAQDEASYENHRDRPEIKQAIQEGRGYDIRKSQSINNSYYYDAILDPGTGLILRVAMPLSELQFAVGGVWIIAIGAMILGILIVCIICAILFRHVYEPMQELTQAAKKMAEGDFLIRVGDSPAGKRMTGEVRQLAQAFNTMADNTRHAVEQMKTKQNQLESVLQGMNDGVLAVDRNNTILFLNQRARDLLDRPLLQEGTLLEGSMRIHKVASVLQEAAANQQVIHQTISEQNGVQQENHYSVYAAPLEGGAEGECLAVISDTTRMTKLEQMRRDFVSNVTHELKTPLTSIRGSIDLLRSADRDEETRQYFYEVLDIEAERLRHLIDDMLVLSQIENAREDPSLTRCDIAKELACAVERLEPIAEKAGVTLHMEVERELFVSSSSTRLQQLFGNLIENAIKYNVPDGRVEITAQRRRDMILVRIKDTGIGIDPSHFDRLFERFYRVDTSRSRSIGGTGLGLSIVKHLTALYGGDIRVESQVGKGTTFTVRLPVMLPDG
ncbi:MAG: HAMP domain-containing protein [Clostridiales bacterium]|jgi:two-component system phosphate regulon sensor histidine kinase PhoR|nr:HAMP domain-containing protein [Clostridiales bacterium]